MGDSKRQPSAARGRVRKLGNNYTLLGRAGRTGSRPGKIRAR